MARPAQVWVGCAIYFAQNIATGLHEFGAARGNRTLATSLEGWSPTIKRPPRLITGTYIRIKVESAKRKI